MTQTRTLRALAATALAAGALVLTACGSSGSSAPDATTTAAPTTTAATSTAASTGGTVSANDATNEELVAAFEAAGIPSAEQWAREVQEYRPYDTSDPALTHLQDELAKYNPDPAVLEKILATLTP